MFLIKNVNAMDATTPAAPPTKQPLRAALLRPVDDVATALTDLLRGAQVSVSSGNVTRDLTLVDDIRIGHKFAVRSLAGNLRIRKYGEYIGRTTRAISAGEWVHEHNLVTAAHQSRQAPPGSRAWHEVVESARVLRVFGETKCAVGENPLYDEERDVFWWIDVRERPAIYRLDCRTGEERVWPMREDIGSIALSSAQVTAQSPTQSTAHATAHSMVPSSGDTLLAALRSGFAWFDATTGAMTPIHDPEPGLAGNRMNDGKCDALGRYWCGSMNPESGGGDGNLYMLDRDLKCAKVLDNLVVPNGMTWSADNRTMYLADTRRGLIWAFDFDLDKATLNNRRVFADYASMPGGPDGATLDSEGFLWSAQVDGGCLIRYAPDGRIDRVVRVPVTRPTSCAFGGKGYRELYVTTSTRGLSVDDVRSEPDAGRVLVLDVGVGGTAPIRFAASQASQASQRSQRSQR